MSEKFCIFWGVPDTDFTSGYPYWPLFAFNVFNEFFAPVLPDADTAFGGHREGRDALHNVSGYPFTVGGNGAVGNNSFLLFHITFPESMSELPIQFDLLDAGGGLVEENTAFFAPSPGAIPDPPFDSFGTSFGKRQDVNGNWYDPIGMVGLKHRTYVTAHLFADGDSGKMRVLTVRADTPTFDPDASALGGPTDIDIAGEVGSEITWKIFTPSDPAETPTPGSNGWSALASTPQTASANTGDELRAQARISGKAWSLIKSAEYT